MAGPGLATTSEGLWLALCCPIEVMGCGWPLEVRGLGLFQGWPIGVRVRAGQAKAGVARHGQAGPSMARQDQALASMGRHDQGQIFKILPLWWKLSRCHWPGLTMPGQPDQATKIQRNIRSKFQY